jgi:hypothetical protein
VMLLIVCGNDIVDCLWMCEVVPLWQNMTKRSMRSHRLYKPSPNKQLFPELFVPFTIS